MPAQRLQLTSSLQGHEVTLIKTSHAMHNQNFNYLINNDGEVRLIEKGKTKLTNIGHVTRDLSCISDSEIIIITYKLITTNSC